MAHHPFDDLRATTHRTLVDNIDVLFAATRSRLLLQAHKFGIQDDAEDIVQETLLEAWRHLDTLREPDRFESWLSGICRNVCLRWSRAEGKTQMRQVSLSVLSDRTADEPVAGAERPFPDDSALDPVEELSRQDLTTLLDHALGYLPSSTREAIELCYLADLPQREAALRLGMTIHALEERLYRARRQLRQLLSNELRSEAESFGLMMDREGTNGWRETRELCRFCGRHRQLGRIESRADGLAHLWTRCPSCSEQYGDTTISGWLPELSGLRSFRPAFKRIDATLRSYFPQALVNGSAPCRDCGKQARLRLVPPNEPFGTFFSPHPQHLLVLECSACGWFSSTWAYGVAFWFHPAPRVFTERHPHWVLGPEVVQEYENQAALRLCLLDMTSTARLVMFAHLQTFHVLTAFEEA